MHADRPPELPGMPELSGIPGTAGTSGMPVQEAAGRAGVLGLGMDLVHIPGLAEQLAVPGTVFAQRSFTTRELREAARRAEERGAGQRGRAEHLAARWAAKEAFIKAWSQALAEVCRANGADAAPLIPPEDLDWRQIELRTDRWGRPWLHLSGEVARAVEDSLGQGASAASHWPVSLTHDADWAAAIVLFQER